MTGIVGSVWTMRDNLTDIAWTARTTLHEASVGIDDPLLSLSWEKQVKAALAEDLHTTLPTAPDVYGFGKEIARMARLALIADELGERSSFFLWQDVPLELAWLLPSFEREATSLCAAVWRCMVSCEVAAAFYFRRGAGKSTWVSKRCGVHPRPPLASTSSFPFTAMVESRGRPIYERFS